jgi:hypothetical protein
LIERSPGDAHASGLRNRLKTSGNVHAVAEQVPDTHHHVADVHSNTEADTAVWRDTGVRLAQRTLRFHCALHGINGAPELRKDTIARRVRYAAPVFPNDPVEDRAPLGQPLERADLVGAHEAAVAFHIGCEDRDETAADYNRV